MAWITNGEKIEKRIDLNKDADMNRLADIIVKKGGNIWTKKGRRAYFPQEVDFIRVPAPVENIYADLDTKEFVFTITNIDEHLYDEVAYKKSLIDFLKNK